ncbi:MULTISPECIES: hypothetical protein [Paracoccus]|uniref:Uncharacterized protein n=1 Tax=Paracoccus fontiphilus TaxID=1815556 RepID=A0ABV7IE80_9RHOB|nr:hypothetical protein [Paracoccus fontiphilus]
MIVSNRSADPVGQVLGLHVIAGPDGQEARLVDHRPWSLRFSISTSWTSARA